ncbi:MAG: hypothetical protein ACK56F_32885, partial [bacterium]
GQAIGLDMGRCAAAQLPLQMQKPGCGQVRLPHRQPHPDHLGFRDAALALIQPADRFAEGIVLVDHQG